MKAVVTGGSGFLGGAIIRQLQARGDEVTCYSRRDVPGLRCVRGDVADAESVAGAIEGADTVFHVASKVGVWGPHAEYHRTNVQGTENVIAACRRHNVPRLVYTSTPSVVFHGQGMEGVDESAPYAESFLTPYQETKAAAEQAVLKANDEKLSTVALRPHLIWGPGDNHLIPRLVERARAGKVKLVGDGRSKVDSVYVDNAAQAHLLAADRLAPGAAPAGKAYFISNGEPAPIADLLNSILAAAGVPPVEKHVSPRAAYAVGWLLEMTYRLFGIRKEPMMTRFVARQMSTPHWFDLSAARRDLDYVPAVSLEEGFSRLRDSFQPSGRSGG